MGTESCVHLAPYQIYWHGREAKHNVDDRVPVSSTSGGQITVRDILIDKQPRGKPLKPSAVAKSNTCESPPSSYV